MDDWDVLAAYSGKGRVCGHRLVHKETGFVLDYLPNDFLPQGFVYVDTPAESDRGEAHALEHVVLGKGRKGHWVRSFTEMSLAQAHAFTMQERTVYTMQSEGDRDCFFAVLEVRLDALMHPDFDDDEVAAELCQMKVDSSGNIEEHGTVYLEQHAAHTRVQHAAYVEVHRMLYGEDHPLGFVSGGTPDAIRTATPEHVRAFHTKHYRLANMGAILVLPGTPLEEAVLTRVSAMLRKVAAAGGGCADDAAGGVNANAGENEKGTDAAAADANGQMDGDALDNAFLEPPKTMLPVADAATADGAAAAEDAGTLPPAAAPAAAATVAAAPAAAPEPQQAAAAPQSTAASTAALQTIVRGLKDVQAATDRHVSECKNLVAQVLLLAPKVEVQGGNLEASVSSNPAGASGNGTAARGDPPSTPPHFESPVSIGGVMYPGSDGDDDEDDRLTFGDIGEASRSTVFRALPLAEGTSPFEAVDPEVPADGTGMAGLEDLPSFLVKQMRAAEKDSYFGTSAHDLGRRRTRSLASKSPRSPRSPRPDPAEPAADTSTFPANPHVTSKLEKVRVLAASLDTVSTAFAEQQQKAIKTLAMQAAAASVSVAAPAPGAGGAGANDAGGDAAVVADLRARLAQAEAELRTSMDFAKMLLVKNTAGVGDAASTGGSGKLDTVLQRLDELEVSAAKREAAAAAREARMAAMLADIKVAATGMAAATTAIATTSPLRCSPQSPGVAGVGGSPFAADPYSLGQQQQQQQHSSPLRHDHGSNVCPAVGRPPCYEQRLPAPAPAPDGSVRTVLFPHADPGEVGLVVCTYPMLLAPTCWRDPEAYLDHAVLSLLMESVASGQGSLVYKQHIAGDPRVGSVASEVKGKQGYSATIAFGGIRSNAITEALAQELVEKFRKEVRAIAEWDDGCAGLLRFNEHIAGTVDSKLNHSHAYLAKSPGFGERDVYGAYATWLDSAITYGGVEAVAAAPGTTPAPPVVDLSYTREADALKALLATKKNFWKEYIAKWGLVARAPQVVLCRADPELHTMEAAAAKQRREAFAADLAAKGITLEAYRADYEARMAAIAVHNGKHDRLPSFTAHPPMDYDPHLHHSYDTDTSYPPLRVLDVVMAPQYGTVDFGVVLSMNNLPNHLHKYIPILQSLHSFGVRNHRGEAVKYAEYAHHLRREVAYLDSYLAQNYKTGRVEVCLRASGRGPVEVERAFYWFETVLTNPLWTKANLPRINDVVVQRYNSVKGEFSRRPEYWAWRVGYPLMNPEPHFMAASCLFTAEHAFLRMKWRLYDYSVERDAAMVDYVRLVSTFTDRDALAAMLKKSTSDHAADLQRLLSLLPPAGDAAGGAQQVSPQWRAVCETLANDIATPPEVTLNEWIELFDLVKSTGLRRAFVLGGTPAAVDDAKAKLKAILQKVPSVRRSAEYLDPAALSAAPPPGPADSVVARAWARRTGLPASDMPLHKALIMEDVSQGVLLHAMSLVPATPGALSAADAKKVLAAKAWTGGGAHTPFLSSWQNGMAYSSGIGSSFNDTMVHYYADHCPNVGKTLEHARQHLESVPTPEGLKNYALCRCFKTRARESPSVRCQNLGHDLADGITPASVRAMRKSLLAAGQQLSDEDVRAGVAHILPLFDPAAATPDAMRLAIGSSKQHDYYKEALGGAAVAKLYPSDFWLMEE